MAEHKEYDAIVVGSGIAGSIMAKTLTQAGKKVLLLEAGLESGALGKTRDIFTNYQGYTNTYRKEFIKTPNSPYPTSKDAPSIDVKEIYKEPSQSYLIQKGPIAFASDCLRIPGGTTNHWLGSTPRMLPNDFKVKSTYGVGVDWPISHKELQPYYEMAELEMGISGDVKGQHCPGTTPEDYGSGYNYPMERIPQSYLDKVIMDSLKPGTKIDLGGIPLPIQYSVTPQARNSNPNKTYPYLDIRWDENVGRLQLTRDHYWHLNEQKWKKAETGNAYVPIGANWDPNVGQRCEGNASCVPICPVQAKYNGLKTLRKSTWKNLKVETQAVVSQVLLENGKVSGIKYIKYQSDSKSALTEHVVSADVYVLAANAIENAKILLYSQAANSSDQVGRNLMDHTTVLGWGLSRSKKLYPFRGPASTTSISTPRDGKFREQYASSSITISNWGWGWPASSPASNVIDAVDNQTLFGTALRDYINDHVTRQFSVHFMCEQLPDPENRVTLSHEFRDGLGLPRPEVHYQLSEYSQKALLAYDTYRKDLFNALDVEDHTNFYQKGKPPTKLKGYIEKGGKRYRIWGTGHIAGTHRMGKSPGDSVTDTNCNCWDHDNLYLIGCGSMPTMGTSNPTLTMAALTFKAAEAVLNQLKK